MVQANRTFNSILLVKKWLLGGVFIKNFITFILFEKKLNAIPTIPNIQEYRRILVNDWSNVSSHRSKKYVNLKGTPSEIKEILPLKSLYFKDVWNGLKEVSVEFDKKEFDSLFGNKSFVVINSLILKYFSNKMKYRYIYFIDNKETFLTLVDALLINYHLTHPDKIIEIVNYLDGEMYTGGYVTNKNLNERIEFEIEFIRQQKKLKKVSIKEG